MKNRNIFKHFKPFFLLITYAIVLYVVLINIRSFGSVANTFVKIFSPVLWGLGFAFVLNLPMNFFERKIFSPFFEKHKRFNRFCKPLSLLFTLLLVLAVITAFISFLIPTLYGSIMDLRDNMPTYASNLVTYLDNVTKNLNISNEYLTNLIENTNKWLLELTSNLGQWLTTAVPTVLNTLMTITSSIVNFVIAFIMALYILLNKAHLKSIVRRILTVSLSKDKVQKIYHVFQVTYTSFSSFFTGQLIEAFVLGGLCFIGMMIFRIDQAFLISSIITITAIIPFFGGFIGAIPSAILLLMTSPEQAIFFVIFIVILQQIEGNLIYPKVVGNTIGLRPIWVLMALIIGGNFFGILGILIGIPAFATVYILLKEYIEHKELAMGLVKPTGGSCETKVPKESVSETKKEPPK